MTIGTRRDNISRALRSLGYEYGLDETSLYKGETTISLGSRGAAVIIGVGKTGNLYTKRLNSAAIAALISAGEYIFLCGSISTSEKRRIENLVP